MTPSLPRLRLPAVVLAGLLALSACGAARPPAAVVDGERITDDQLQQNIVLFKFLTGLTRGACGQPIQGESAESACARFTLSNLIQEDLIKHYATAHSLTVSVSSVTDAITQLASNLGGAQQLGTRLKSQGLTQADLNAFATRLLLFREVQRALAAGQVSDAQLMQTYQQQQAQFTQVHVAHILVKTKSEALKIEKQVTEENFGDLAARYSIDTSNAQQGGDLGTISEAQFSATFDQTFVQATLAITPGEISEPVHTQFGWHVIHLISLDVQPFDQVKQQILDQAAGSVFQQWLSGRLTSAKITVNPKYGHLDSATGQILPTRSTATSSPSSAASPSASP